MKLPSPPAPVISHGLSSRSCELIANILLTWGAADDEIGNALLFTYGITEGEIAEDLVLGLDSRKKRDLLKKALNRRDQNHPALTILRQVITAADKWASERNLLAHGFGAISETGTVLVSSLGKTPLPVEKLSDALNRANWLYLACSEIRRIMAGSPSGDSLPDMPA